MSKSSDKRKAIQRDEVKTPPVDTNLPDPVTAPMAKAGDETPVITVFVPGIAVVEAVFLDGHPYPFEQRPTEKNVHIITYQLREPEAWPQGMTVELFGKRDPKDQNQVKLAVNKDLRPQVYMCWDADPLDHFFA